MKVAFETPFDRLSAERHFFDVDAGGEIVRHAAEVARFERSGTLVALRRRTRLYRRNRMPAFRTLTIALLTMGSVQGVAFADPIQITDGAATGTALGLHLVITGERGLAIDAGLARSDGIYAPAEQCFGPPCLPGRPFSLNAAWFGGISGTASFEGRTFSLGQQDEQTGAMNAFFEGILLLPPFAGERFGSAAAPFTFSGALFPPFESGFPPDVPLQGRGTATATFEWPNPDIPNSWIFRDIRYEFESAAPIPEPSSLILIGTGLGGLALRRWRRTSRARC